MKPSEIKRKRQASLLRELISEAVGQLDDERLHGITVTEVDVKKGGYDADVYIDKSFYSPEEQKEILKALKKAAPLLQSYCLEMSGWFKCPKFHFKFDELLEQQKKIEDLFAKIKEEK
ncbi:ribosome-binding factor A [Nitratiruptor sp. YY08-26]|uniref:30S ribosome-binding factor RbfA n=1 Tax=unclassified Nitratiruptor TaxID=2624044 RepID=UPI001935732B|nr:MULTISPECIES: 30S ribosome-binding factor RbfA [unclassified Nitratiruptor]BCD61609.1 ribosome-binding factor A [Nitratiruptor sp. YY08-13]BCD65543.1 ribosome-binding factor A [Nitratiruptor sp. YY08-26]